MVPVDKILMLSKYAQLMRPSLKRHSLLLVLILILSQIGLAVHAAEHIDQSEHQVCQICHARDDYASAVPGTTGFSLVETSTYHSFVCIEPSYTSAPTANYSARAPPISQ